MSLKEHLDRLHVEGIVQLSVGDSVRAIPQPQLVLRSMRIQLSTLSVGRPCTASASNLSLDSADTILRIAKRLTRACHTKSELDISAHLTNDVKASQWGNCH